MFDYDSGICFVEGWIELPTENNPALLKCANLQVNDLFRG